MPIEQDAIVVKDVSKTFKLPHEQHSGIKQAVINIFNRKSGYEVQRVLDNVSFEIKKGEFFGIVGRNGSGKSTLLKLLAGIYVPDKGLIQVNGSLTPFIELGVGFNPELTGRENVFLNGALLGFSRPEIQTMYGDIVDFAELEEFMDQKLKNYSSGMQVRLAFSIAIRAESDILLLDEVLAVGDEAFQRKCFDYFKQLKRNKKTVVLVTHSMESMKRFCNKAILIKGGEIVASGSPDDIANRYTQDNLEAIENENSTKKGNKHKDSLSERISYLKVTSNSKKVLSSKDVLKFSIEYEITDDTPVHVFFSILDEKRGGSILANGTKPITGRGKHKLTYVFPLKYYNDTDLLIAAALDEAETKKRIAFTTEANFYRFAIRNKTSDNSLLSKDNDIHGYWVDQEEYMYNLKEM